MVLLGMGSELAQACIWSLGCVIALDEQTMVSQKG